MLEQYYNLHHNVLKEFKKDGTVYYSEHINSFQSGILYWINNKQEYVDAVKEVEDKYNVFVYHCILNHTEMDDWLTMLFVSGDTEMWKYDLEDLETTRVFAYVYTFNEDSEFGYVDITGVNGGLDRVA